MEEQQGKRDDILPVMLNNRYEGAAIAGVQVRLVKFWYHLAGNIILTVNMQDLPFQCGEA